jgi:PAS domain S-box-containing protein
LAEDLYRHLVERGLGLMCVHDLGGVILYLNPAAAETLGYRWEEAVQRNLREFLTSRVRPLFDLYLDRIRKHGSDSGFMRMTARDGSEQVWFYRNRLEELPGEEARVLGHAQNVTGLVRAAAGRSEDLEHANERLQLEIQHRRHVEEELLQSRKMESLAVLAGGIAHDFNNVLTVIAGNLALAQMRAHVDPSLGHVLTQAERACARACALSQQLLTFAKGGAPVRRDASVARIVAEAVALALEGSKSRLDLRVAPDLWPVVVDPGQISQAMQSVLLNAGQAMPEGGTVEISSENAEITEPTVSLAAGRYVKLWVRDHGHGIPEGDLPRIFDPYFSTRRGGSGLGLATAYAILRKHQGAISAESAPGRGTTITIYLPASAASGTAAPEGPQMGTGRVLVMDDEAPIRELARNVLESLGYEAEGAADGAEAVACYQAALSAGKPFAAVLLDLTVPGGMGGIEALKLLRELDPSVRAIVSSGYSDDPVMAHAAEYGFQGVVSKPWNIPTLSDVLKRVLAR